MRLRFGWVLLLAIGLAGGLPVRGEETDRKEGESAGENNEPVQSDYREEVVVTATRSETPFPEVGSSVTVITREELARRRYRFLLDALRDVPGLTVRRSGGPGTATSIFTRGTDSDQTLVMIDGVKIHDPSSPNGAAVLNHLLVEEIERIEVVRGPQSTLYGSQAIGGVVNVITRRGEGKPAHSLALEAGTYDTRSGRFRSRGGTERFDYSLSATRIDTGGFSTRAGDPEDDPYRNDSFTGSFGFRTGEAFRLDLMVRHLESDLEVDAGSEPADARELTRQTVFRLEPRWTAFDGRWEQKLAVSSFEIERDNRVVGFAFPSAFDGSIRRVDWQHDWMLTLRHRMTAGVEYEHQDAEGRVSGVAGFDADTYNQALYVQEQFAGRGGFSSTIGFRVDDHEIFGGQFTYRMSGTWNPGGSGTRFLGSVGTGFKAPSLTELFDSSFGSNNPDLRPEESFGADLGVNQALANGRAAIGVTAFYNDVDQMIVAVFDGIGFSNINIEEAETRGVETFFEFLPRGSWNARVNYTYTDSEAKRAASFGITDGSELLRRPRHEAGGQVSYLFPGDKGQATFSVNYVGERQDLDPISFATVTAEDYLVAHLSGSVRVGGMVELFGRVENLFDEEYQEVLGFNAPGRGVFAGAAVRF